MSDIWSGLGVDISGPKEGEWLYRSHGEMRGPVPLKAIAAKLASGELDLETEVGKEGGEFHPVTRVAAFATHVTEAKKQAQKRAARRRRRLLVMIVVPLVLALAGVGYFVYDGIKKAEADKVAKAKAAAEELAQKRAREEATPEMGLVALVSLGNEDSVKIRNEPQPGTKPKPKPKQPGTSSSPSKPEPEEEMVASCKLNQGDILGTLRKNLGKINVCVEDEKSRDTQGLLPPQLELDFVVLTSGKVTEFKITDRHYRTGPLNNCMIKAFNTISFPSSNGAPCPVTIPIKIGK